MNNKARYLIWVLAAAILVALGAALLLRTATEQAASERALAAAAILGRWSAIDAGTVGQSFLLDFPVTGKAVCLYRGPEKQPRAAVTFQIRQEPLHQRVMDMIRHQKASPAIYLVWISSGPAAAPLGHAGQPWQGRLLGDGNVLVLSPADKVKPAVLRRIGSG